MKLLPYLATLFFILALAVVPQSIYAQGCSDAGFCTMGALRPDQKYNQRIQFKLRSVEVSQYMGMTRFKDFIHVTTAEATIGINDANSIHLKLPFQVVNGPLGTYGGIGDLSLSYTRSVLEKADWQLQGSVGFKVPLNSPTYLNSEGLPLPMYYQSTLGTYDIIAGASFISRHWLVATGVQHALTDNSNAFLWRDWEGHPLGDFILKYPQSNQLRRGTDIMLRVQYNLRLGDKSFYTGLLPIYRLNDDSILNPEGERVTIADSDGLALTWLTGGSYQFSVQSGLKFMAGMVLRQRLKNPDGLSRKYVFTVGYEYRF